MKTSGYTLFEILLVLALIAVIGGAIIPFWGGVAKGQGEQIGDDIREFVRKNRAAAIRRSEPRRIAITESGLESPEGSVSIPGGWKLEVQRYNENKFRPPVRVPMPEMWEITSDGLLEPLTLRAYTLDGNNEVVIEFCSLTAHQPQP